MLIIRKEQMEVFEKASSGHFEPRAVQHLKQAFPKSCAMAGDKAVRQLANSSSQRAKKYHLTSQSAVRLFTDLMFLLGAHFDTDPQLPWASEVLNSKDPTDESAKARRLHAEATTYLDRVFGAGNKFYAEARQRLLDTSIEVPPGAGRLTDATLASLGSIWPQKFEELGEEGARLLSQNGTAQANTYGITGERGCLVFVILMFLFGSGFANDPLTPWAGNVLNDRQLSGDKRVRKLFTEAINHLKQQDVSGAYRPAVPASSAIASYPHPSPVFGRQYPVSTALACARMVIVSMTGKDIPEAVMQEQSAAFPGGFTAINGIKLDSLAELLRANGVTNASAPKQRQGLDELSRATACKDTPAIVYLSNNGGRCVVLDEVRTSSGGNKTLLIRDPMFPSGAREIKAEDLENLGYYGCAITTDA